MSVSRTRTGSPSWPRPTPTRPSTATTRLRWRFSHRAAEKCSPATGTLRHFFRKIRSSPRLRVKDRPDYGGRVEHDTREVQLQRAAMRRRSTSSTRKKCPAPAFASRKRFSGRGGATGARGCGSAYASRQDAVRDSAGWRSTASSICGVSRGPHFAVTPGPSGPRRRSDREGGPVAHVHRWIGGPIPCRPTPIVSSSAQAGSPRSRPSASCRKRSWRATRPAGSRTSCRSRTPIPTMIPSIVSAVRKRFAARARPAIRSAVNRNIVPARVGG
jgi:hypothetical protein